MQEYMVPISWVVTKTVRVFASSPERAEEIAYRMWDQSLTGDMWVEEDVPTVGSSSLDWATDSIEVDVENIEEVERGILWLVLAEVTDLWGGRFATTMWLWTVPICFWRSVTWAFMPLIHLTVHTPV